MIAGWGPAGNQRAMRCAIAVLLLMLAAPAPAAGQASTYQAGPEHAGFVNEPRVAPPLRQAWSRSFPDEFSYAVIGDGKVFVTAPRGDGHGGVDLFALSARDGRTLWRRDLGRFVYHAQLAYEAGRVFVTHSPENALEDPGLHAFAARDGAPLWAVRASRFPGLPTVSDGVVYIGQTDISGIGAYRATDGAQLWLAPTESGPGGAVTVSADSVFSVSGCPDVYAVRRSDGAQLWHPENGCNGGGGSTPVFHAGRLYVRDDDDFPPGDVWDAATGAILGPMRSDLPPAFGGGLGIFSDRLLPGQSTHRFGHTLTARSVRDGRVRWRFRGDGYLDSAPLIVNRTVYVGSGSGRLYGLSLRSGRVVWRTRLRGPIPSSGDFTGTVSGLAAGEGLLVVPEWRRLVAFRRR